MAKTDWQMGDIVKPEDLNALGEEINAKNTISELPPTTNPKDWPSGNTVFSTSQIAWTELLETGFDGWATIQTIKDTVLAGQVVAVQKVVICTKTGEHVGTVERTGYETWWGPWEEAVGGSKFDALQLQVVEHLNETVQPISTDTTRNKHVSNNDLHRLQGTQSHISDTGRISTMSRVVCASTLSRASGLTSAVVSSDGSEANGVMSVVQASQYSRASRAHSVVVSSFSSTAVAANRSIVLASVGTLNNDSNSVAGGATANPNAYTKRNADGSPDLSTTTTDLSVAESWPDGYFTGMSANRKWDINSFSGNIRLAGQVTPGHAFMDFAEVFPNLTGVEQGFGLLQAIDGYGVRPAQEGEDVIGVTSATAGIILGDTPFSWADRWLKNEWGSYIYEEVPDPTWEPLDGQTENDRPYINVPKENPAWNPEIEQHSRLDRPSEWSVVGLVGQVFVRLKEDVQVGDYVKAWQDGVGQKSTEKTNIIVMKITQEYNATEGYKIGFCFLK